MTSFLTTVIKDLLKTNDSLSNLTFILPSKRAGAFLRREISSQIIKPEFSPAIISIEEFTEQVSGLATVDNTTTLFEFYSVYKNCTPAEETEEFENFSSWAQTLIHDFNEIDRYLIPQEKIFNYLADIQDITHWSLAKEKTDIVKNYLAFWKKLPVYYRDLQKNLIQNAVGYQGMVYREAAEKIAEFAGENATAHVFVGFNALNNAEQRIFQTMLEKGARVYWDLDEVHFRDKEHDAGLFLREYAATWPYYDKNRFEILSNNYSLEKEIEIIGIPKQIGQAKYVGELLESLPPGDLDNTALVLGDETLLLPVLNSIPNNIPALNITMGYPLKYSNFSLLFEKMFEFFKNEDGRYYYKDVISVLSNPIIQRISRDRCRKVIAAIKNENLLYLSPQQIQQLFRDPVPEAVKLIFPSSSPPPRQAIENILLLISHIKESLNEEQDALNLEFLYRYRQVALQLEELLKKYPHIKSINALHHFYNEISSLHALDFQGKPFQGLQLMGMLESRVLDFETVILTSVDEGTLPAGKSNNSFIPFELKKTFGLPTYKEKDAVYTYHFYHLLQRAKKVYLLHNTDTEGSMGGEKSRFLLQLELEKQMRHKISTTVITPKVKHTQDQLQEVEKTPEVMEMIREIAGRGFSPSALTTYIRNPLDFYLQYILKIRDKEEVEETVAFNTLGTVVHKTLEEFYGQLKDKQLTLEDIEAFRKATTAEVKRQFTLEYSSAPLSKGKNLLIFEVARRYVLNFLKMESNALQGGSEVFIKEVEANLSTSLDIPELDFPVNIRGNVDRVDIHNDVLRIIDYKTGKVEQPQLEICNWDDIITDYDKFSKPFQVLMYATMLLENRSGGPQVEAGVISFKNLKQGFLKFAKKEHSRDRNKNYNIDPEVLENFKVQLKYLIKEICDPKIPFLEKEIKNAYGTY
ncbi:PD-(D/E)XK nuclease family protein [Antarcticibacterium flavum]|uniref:PD-(D/E)XK nuclease family protein n=1 Tax=Antarcticibacterium flavum TaxID=2058175 RepID=A0A5B7X334_9FLAO|nr:MULTISPECIES: PD-(D/E)XK nuclease family protein [Antarcticibacterium]MCM4160151.1 PD-(D/E)XK nuclease family protein [Antarcticibacterium sp. W02-3]QCY69700.1 PD-(D/E)XK nuclease family protein [Antarcticibacterium flavum]